MRENIIYDKHRRLRDNGLRLFYCVRPASSPFLPVAAAHCTALKPSALLPPPCTPFPLSTAPSSPFTSASMPACQAAPESNRRIISPASPAPAPQRPQPLFLCAQTARLTHAAPAASPFSKNSPQKTSSSAPLLRKHQSSFRLHPPLHASHPFIARPPSPLPGTSPPQPSAFHRMFHLEASSPRSTKASLCHALPAPPLPEASACAAAPCPEVSRRPQLLPFFLQRLSTVCGRNIPPL